MTGQIDLFTGRRMTVAGLFAGIGGIETGLHEAGYSTTLLCEIDPAAQAVLQHRFPTVPLAPDILTLDSLPEVDVVAAGFPCQDLSQAGRTVGIAGSRSGLVSRVFALLERADPDWLVLENVSFMLHLGRGAAMRYLTQELERLGYRWAYRVLDTMAFGLPQRRQRVFLLASRRRDPRQALFGQDVGAPEAPDHDRLANGFYWTEGLRGLGWAVDAVPTLKGGSTLGIPSPPAIWMPDGTIVTPDIRDAERLQGFDADWTLPAALGQRRAKGPRWKLVGNAVSVPVARWVGERLTEEGKYDESGDSQLPPGSPWPQAAWGADGQVVRSPVSTWPIRAPRPHLADFLRHPVTPLSFRATAGFLSRAKVAKLIFPRGFIAAVSAHSERVGERAAVA